LQHLGLKTPTFYIKYSIKRYFSTISLLPIWTIFHVD
jgi:hypothetical protein